MITTINFFLDVCKTLLNTQEAGVGETKGLVDAIKKVHKVAGLKGFFKGMQARVLYQMPATAICWSTYEFFKYMLNRVEKKKETVIITAATSPQLPKEISLQFDDNKKQLHYVLPSNGPKITNDLPSTSIHPASSTTSGLKPRELPAMSSSGLVYAHTMHTQEKTNASHLTDFRSNT